MLRTQAASRRQPAPGRNRTPILFLLAVLLASFVVYIPALHNGFAGDDLGLIVNNPRLANSSPFGVLGQDFARGATVAFQLPVSYYRPLVNLSFWLDRHIWGLHPLPWHLHNVVLNLLCILLVFLILRRLVPSPFWPGLGSVLFALHPMHAESVAYVSGRTDLLMALFVLLAFYLLLPSGNENRQRLPSEIRDVTSRGPRLILAVVSFALALLAKETAIMFAAFVPVWLLVFLPKSDRPRNRWLIVSWFAAIVVGYLALRSAVVRTPLRLTPDVTPAQFPLLMLNTIGLYVRLFFWPFAHQPYYPLRPDFTAVTAYAGVAVVFLVAAVPLTRSRATGGLSLGLAWAILFLLPVLNLLFLSGPMAAERFLYLPSFGFVLVIAALGQNMLGERRPVNTVAAGICAAVAVSFGINIWLLSPVWGSDLALARAMVKAAPDFAMAHNRLGVALRNEGDAASAATEFQAAIRLKTDYAEAHGNLGSTAEARGDLSTAMTEYRLAVNYDSLSAVAQNNLGSALGKTGESDSAIIHFNTALRLKPDYVEVLNNLGVTWNAMGDVVRAEAAFRQALALRPGYVRAMTNLARLRLAQQNTTEARTLLTQASHLAPADPEIRRLLDMLSSLPAGQR